MDLSVALGRPFLARLTDAAHAPLVIGKDRYTITEVATMGLCQLRACRILSAIAADLKVRSVHDLYKQTSPYTLAGRHGCGVSTLYVLLRLFEAESFDVDAWYAAGKDAALVSFVALKVRELKAEARTEARPSRHDKRTLRRQRASPDRPMGSAPPPRRTPTRTPKRTAHATR